MQSDAGESGGARIDKVVHAHTDAPNNLDMHTHFLALCRHVDLVHCDVVALLQKEAPIKVARDILPLLKFVLVHIHRCSSSDDVATSLAAKSSARDEIAIFGSG